MRRHAKRLGFRPYYVRAAGRRRPWDGYLLGRRRVPRCRCSHQGSADGATWPPEEFHWLARLLSCEELACAENEAQTFVSPRGKMCHGTGLGAAVTG